MTFPLDSRSSGILLHPTSLPGPLPNGDIGPAARQFVDFLHDSGQRWWQMLPIHPIGGGDSPYDSPSAYAGNELLVSLEDLIELGLLEPDELRGLPRLMDLERCDFVAARQTRLPLLRRAFDRFSSGGYEFLRHSYDEFLAYNHSWVWDFGLFSTLRTENQYRSWVEWSPELRGRDPEALARAREAHDTKIRFEVFVQFLFHYQWGKLRAYAREKRVSLMGDVPMFVAHDSADVWANQGMFFLDEQGRRTVQAGVPPDYFSEDGQLWGNPLYRWDAMRRDGYGWWIDRLRRELSKFDSVRLDHFIALSRYWEVPIDARSAKEGHYVDAPGYDFLEHAGRALGGLPFVAEDLGIVTREVEALRDHFHLPGMKVLQFSFAPGAEIYLPHRHEKNCVAYLGTHDNATTRGWFEALLLKANQEGPVAVSAREELRRLQGYTGISRPLDASRQLIRTLMASPARTVIVTTQDLLDQGDDHRMNVPGVGTGNWTYRLAPGQLNRDLSGELRTITSATERI